VEKGSQDMNTITTIRSPAAIAVGVFFTGVTSWVLLEDVFRHGASVNTKHVMTLAVLAGTIFFGHTMWQELRAWRLGTAFGCIVLFLAGTTTCVLMSAGRNAEVVTNKTLAANSVNTERQRAARDRDEASARYSAALTAEEAECGSGDGIKCQAKRATRKSRREDLDAAEAALRNLRPEQIANADLRAAAQLLSRLPLVTTTAEKTEALLQLFLPFMLSLFCEVGAIVGYSVGLGHRTAMPRIATPANDQQLPPKLPATERRQQLPRSSDAEMVLKALQRAGRPVSNAELATLLGVTPGEASKRVLACRQLLRVERVGRYVAISPAKLASTSASVHRLY
jgi:hypothetical protein